VAFTDIKYQYFIIYAATNAAAVPIVYFLFPETNNRSLEELDEIFAPSKSIFDTVRVAKRLPKRRLSTFLEEEGKIDPELGAQHLERTTVQDTQADTGRLEKE
jgi:hypothetical protein